MADYEPDFVAVGSEGQVAFGLETAEGVPGATKTYMRIESESMMTERPLAENPNSDPSGLAVEPVSLIAACKGKVSKVIDLSTLLLLRLNHRGWYAITNPIAGVADWQIRNRFIGVDAAVPAYVDSLFFDIFRGETIDDLPRGYYLGGAKCDELDFSVSANEFAKLSHSYLWSRDKFMGDAEEVTVPADFAGQILIFGHRNDPASTGQIRFRITTSGAFDGTAMGKFSKAGSGTVITNGTVNIVGTPGTTHFLSDYIVGQTIMITGETSRVIATIPTDETMTLTVAATTTGAGKGHYIDYGATAYPLVANTRIPVIFGDLSKAGIITEREEVYIVIVPEAGDTGTALDEWGFDAQRGVGVPVYATGMQLTGVDVDADATIGGVTRTYALNQMDLKYTRPLKLNYGLGRKYPFGVIKGGGDYQKLEITLKRDFTDLDFFRGAIAGAAVNFHWLAQTGPITGVPGYYEEWEGTSELTRVEGAGSAISTKGTLPESIKLVGFTRGSQPLLTERIRNGILALP